MNRVLEVLDARMTIANLMFEYAEAVDRADIETVGSLFGRGLIDSGGVWHRGEQAVFELYSGTIIFYDQAEQPTDYQRFQCSPRTRHVTTNLHFTFDEAVRRADVRSYFTVYQTLSGATIIIAGGRYEDSFEKDAAGWHFAERRILVENMGDMSRHLRTP